MIQKAILVKVKTLNFDSLKAVVLDGKEIGFITKYKNTRSERHPWKIYLGKGETNKFLGTTYISEVDAMNHVVSAHVNGTFGVIER